MRLRELLEGTEITALTISPDTEITHVCADSRRARKGSLFAAVPGTLCDGALYAQQAVDKIACTWYENPAARLTSWALPAPTAKPPPPISCATSCAVRE